MIEWNATLVIRDQTLSMQQQIEEDGYQRDQWVRGEIRIPVARRSWILVLTSVVLQFNVVFGVNFFFFPTWCLALVNSQLLPPFNLSQILFQSQTSILSGWTWSSSSISNLTPDSNSLSWITPWYNLVPLPFFSFIPLQLKWTFGPLPTFGLNCEFQCEHLRFPLWFHSSLSLSSLLLFPLLLFFLSLFLFFSFFLLPSLRLFFVFLPCRTRIDSFLYFGSGEIEWGWSGWSLFYEQIQGLNLLWAGKNVTIWIIILNSRRNDL